MAYLVAGPMVALVGIVAVFFVLRRKSVEKRSMYSARRSQIEHKVRAARQRTLTPRGRSERQAEQTTAEAAPAFAPQSQQTVTYETPAYEAPPLAPPSQQPVPYEPPAYEAPPMAAPAAPSSRPEQAPPPWDTPASPAPATSF